jgi:hypothetical protein
MQQINIIDEIYKGDLSDKAFNTLAVLRNATWLNSDTEIMESCREVFNYLKERA